MLKLKATRSGLPPLQWLSSSDRIALTTFLFFLFVCIVPAFANPSIDKQVVLKQKTGLMWQKGDSFNELNKGMNWYEAQEYVDRKNAQKFAGFNDWRLPTLEELNQLWDASRPVKNKDGENVGLPKEFAPGGSYYLWTGDERGLDNVWYFGLGHKENYFNLKDLGDLDQGVKLVRNLKEGEG